MTGMEHSFKNNRRYKFVNHLLMCFLARKKLSVNCWFDVGYIRKTNINFEVRIWGSGFLTPVLRIRSYDVSELSTRGDYAMCLNCISIAGGH